MYGPAERARVVVLVSGTGTLLQALVDAAAGAWASHRVAGVVSDRTDAGGLERARAARIPTAVVAPEGLPRPGGLGRRRSAERSPSSQPDLVVLAGFMQILGAGVPRRVRGPHDQHPPRPAAGVPRRARRPGRARPRGEGHRCARDPRGRRRRHRADRRPAGRRRAATTTTRRPCTSASRSSSGSCSSTSSAGWPATAGTVTDRKVPSGERAVDAATRSADPAGAGLGLRQDRAGGAGPRPARGRASRSSRPARRPRASPRPASR